MVFRQIHFVSLLALRALLTTPASAQDAGRVNPTDFLPLEVGNQWTYAHYYSNEALYEYHRSLSIYTAPYWAEPGSPMRDVVQALFGLPGHPWYPDEQDDFWKYDNDRIETYQHPPTRELTFEITHTEIIEGHEYFVFSPVPYDWPPVPNFFLAGQKVRFSDDGALLIRWNEQDIPFYAFHAEEPYRLPAYPVLHNENPPVELTIWPGSPFSIGVWEFALLEITPPPSLSQATGAGFFIAWDIESPVELTGGLSWMTLDEVDLGAISFASGYGPIEYKVMRAATGDLGFILPAFRNAIFPLSAVIGGQPLEFSHRGIPYTSVQPTTWGQLKARHGQHP